MSTLIFVLVWVVLGVGLLLIALSGGPGGALQRVMSTSRRGRRVATVLFALAVLVLGIGVPAAVIAAVSSNDSIPEANVTDLTAAEKHGRDLFGRRCANCHTLKAANAIAEIGPNLDVTAPEQGARAGRDREGPLERQRPDGGQSVHRPGRRGRGRLRRQGGRPDRSKPSGG